MRYDVNDDRRPLESGESIIGESGEIYVVDRLIGSGGFALCYLAHLKDERRYTVLKELFPKRVEGGVAVRRADGRIVIYDPIGGTEENDEEAVWQQEEKVFRREADLAGKAALIFDAEGKPVKQNHPDVLAVTGPFRDTRGNRYVAIDTAQGEPLKKLIERGFVKDGKGEVVANAVLGDVLAVLEKTAKLLSRLHRENRLLHLDISPENIYLTAAAAGTELLPHILDYGSAYDLDDPSEEVSHHYTCNAYSPPEILALADLNASDSGYRPDESSDTYGVVNLLFYAVTGQVYTPAMAFDESWRRALRREYTRERHGEKDGKAFSELLIDVFETGLAAGQRKRYRSAEALDEALQILIEADKGSRGLLNGMDVDELMSYLLLEKYPLYRYRNAAGELELLFLGGGAFVQRMILSAVSCGQMPEAPLRIRVVSRESEETFRCGLLHKAPLLKDYSDLSGEAGKENWVSFSYECNPNVQDPEAVHTVLAHYPDCRWVLVSLGGNRENAETARLLAEEMIARGIGEPAVILYHAAEDAGRNVRRAGPAESASRRVEPVPFGTGFLSCQAELRALEERTLRLSYLYDRLSDPRAALEDSTAALVDPDPAKVYGLRSSCASALHAKYKLAAVGIDPEKDGLSRSAEAYRELLRGPARGMLLQLEHRRWMMYMAADGYRLPTMEELAAYGFAYSGDKFNDSFK